MSQRWTLIGKVKNPKIRWGNEIPEEMKSILQEKMKEAWRTPEAIEMKKKLSKIKKIWE